MSTELRTVQWSSSVDVRRVLSYVLEKQALVGLGKKHLKYYDSYMIYKIPKTYSVNKLKISKHYLKGPTPELGG